MVVRTLTGGIGPLENGMDPMDPCLNLVESRGRRERATLEGQKEKWTKDEVTTKSEQHSFTSQQQHQQEEIVAQLSYY